MGGRFPALKRSSIHIVTCACFAFGGLALLASGTAAQLGPQSVVREFCRLDALGARATVHGWPQVAQLVAWELEPAWDRVVLVTSYTVGWPLAREDNSFTIEVRYAVHGTVTASGFEPSAAVESRTFRVEPGVAGDWRIAGPPPPPHIFAHDVDVAAMQRSLQQGGVNFIPNSLLVWQLYQRNGWDIPFEHTAALGRTQVFRNTEKPAPGDLVLYLDGDTPYHVGVLESEEVVVSATLNAGIVRTPIDAFPGARRTLHLRPPEFWPPTPTPKLLPEQFYPTVRPTPVPEAVSTPSRRTRTTARTPAKKRAVRRTTTTATSKTSKRRNSER